jgi:hypothetical protein
VTNQPQKVHNAINFFFRNLRMFVKSLSLLGRPFQSSLMYVGKARRRANERCFTWVGYSLTCKHQAGRESFAKVRHSSLLLTFVNYEGKSFVTLCSGHFFVIRDIQDLCFKTCYICKLCLGTIS